MRERAQPANTRPRPKLAREHSGVQDAEPADASEDHHQIYETLRSTDDVYNAVYSCRDCMRASSDTRTAPTSQTDAERIPIPALVPTQYSKSTTAPTTDVALQRADGKLLKTTPETTTADECATDHISFHLPPPPSQHRRFPAPH